MTHIALPEPDHATIARRSDIVAGLSAAIGADRVISDEDGRRAYETDALTAYRRMPLAVVLPRSTEEVASVLRYCNREGIKVIPRGAGTSLAGGALPAEDAVVVCVTKLNRVIDIDYENRTARVETGITNLAISAAVSERGYFYAPDPSSQLACTLAGNIAMNSGGAHCLKYGVTTNNVLGVRMVLMDGEIVEIGGPHLDAPGYDLLALIVGSEGCSYPAFRRRRTPDADGLPLGRICRRRRFRDHRGRHHSRRDRVHGQAGDPRVRVVLEGRLSHGCRGPAHHRGRGLRNRDR